MAETANVPRRRFDFDHRAESDQSFENALAKARNGNRLSVDDAVELLTTGSDHRGIDPGRKRQVLEAADRRRAAVVGDEVTVVANLNNNVTTACNTGCLFCNFKDAAELFLAKNDDDHPGFTKSPADSREIVADAVEQGIYEVTSVSGLHPALALDEEHRELLETSDRRELDYRRPEEFGTDPGAYTEQVRAMSETGAHVHAVTPEEAQHARRATDWSFEEVYDRLQRAGLGSVPGTAAEVLVEEVRDVICPAKIGTDKWVAGIEAAAAVGLPTTATIMYGHIENERHRALHLSVVRDLQDRTGAITEFVPLSFVHGNTPLAEHGLVESGPTPAEDELMVAVSRLFLDNIDHIQSSWVKYGDEQGLKMLSAGADDFMGTVLSEEITSRAGGDHGEYRSFEEYVELITAIDRVPVERSTDYRERRRIPTDDPPAGPRLGPKADGTPLVE